MIEFRNYKHYPLNIMDVCIFRDDYDEEPDGAFFAIAAELGLSDALEEMAEWEAANTEIKKAVVNLLD